MEIETKWSRKYEKCIDCGTTTYRHQSLGRCLKCAQKYYEKNRQYRKCGICKKYGRISKIIDNIDICKNCYAKHYIPKKECYLCHKIKTITLSTNNQNICKSCYSKYFVPKEKCDRCGNIRKIATKKDGIKTCTSCYKHYVAPRKCSICEKYKYIEAVIDGKHICQKCYDLKYRPRELCSICNNVGIIKLNKDGSKICSSCYDKYFRPKHICNICKKESIAKKILNGNYICENCYNKNYRPKRRCFICHEVNKIKKINNGKEICESCYNKIKNKCNECGKLRVSFNYSLNICDNCSYKKKLISKLTELRNEFQSVEIYDLYKKYVTTLLKYNYSATKLYYKVLEEMKLFKLFESKNLQTQIPLYQIINEYFDNSSMPNSMINFFLKGGILEPKFEIDLFKDIHLHNIKNVPLKFLNIFDKYSLYLIAIKNKLIQLGWTNKFGRKYYFACLRQAKLLLIFLDKKIDNISELNQIYLDDFILNKCRNNGALKKFIKFLNKNVKLFRNLYVPIKKINSQLNLYTKEELNKIFDFLTKPSISNRDRIIVFLLIFYVIRPIEITLITLNDFVFVNNIYYIFVRNTWIIIEPLLGSIITKYIDYERSDKLSLGSETKWLFPGNIYNKPISSKHIYSLLGKLGVSTRRSVKTAIANFLLTPGGAPSLMIRGMGMRIETVMSYYKNLNISSIYEYTQPLNATNNIKNDKTTVNEYVVYILKCNDGSYYTGYTSDIQKRFKQHQSGIGCTYTKSRTPVELVYTEELPDKLSALKREKQIKKLTIFEKEQLIDRSRMN